MCDVEPPLRFHVNPSTVLAAAAAAAAAVTRSGKTVAKWKSKTDPTAAGFYRVNLSAH